MWIRGCANVSPRIARNDTLLVEPLLHAERLRMRGGRKDVFVSGWIASRVETAERVARGVRVEGERMAREMMERERKREMVESERRERSRRKCEERERWMREREERERCGVGVMTRRRREVCYVESEDEGEEEREEGEFVCEELIDGSDHDESASEEEEEEEETEEESERENARVVGRVRVCVSERSRRAERRARLTEKYASEEEEDEDEGGRGVRRSKRLRMSK